MFYWMTFIKAPPRGWHLWFWEKYLDSFWMDRHLMGSQLQLEQRVNRKKLNCQLLWFFSKRHSKIIIINHPKHCFLHNMYTDTDRSGIGQYQPITPADWYKLDPLIFIPAPSSQKPTTQQTDTGENTTRLAEVTTFGSMNHYRKQKTH